MYWINLRIGDSEFRLAIFCCGFNPIPELFFMVLCFFFWINRIDNIWVYPNHIPLSQKHFNPVSFRLDFCFLWSCSDSYLSWELKLLLSLCFISYFSSGEDEEKLDLIWSMDEKFSKVGIFWWSNIGFALNRLNFPSFNSRWRLEV